MIVSKMAFFWKIELNGSTVGSMESYETVAVSSNYDVYISQLRCKNVESVEYWNAHDIYHWYVLEN